MNSNSPQQLNDVIYEIIPETLDDKTAMNNNNQKDERQAEDLADSGGQIYNLTNTSKSFNNNDRKLSTNAVNNLMINKDALYATPMRKFDRFKVRKLPSGLDGEKISNLNHNNNLGCEDLELRDLLDRTHLNNELGENRIKDFLKDTGHMHKRIEPPGKEHISSSFSYLVRKEHFVNLVHQNVLKDDNVVEDYALIDDESGNVRAYPDDIIEPCENLEETERLINKLVNYQSKAVPQVSETFSSPRNASRLSRRPTTINLNREWVLKKIAMSLEQKTFKKLPPTLPETVTKQQIMANSNLPVVGYLVLGSNGSGKTTICNDIILGSTGTKGLLNRRLLSFYYVNSQNPNCHSLSVFIRNTVLQILSFSSLWNKNECVEICGKDDEAIKREDFPLTCVDDELEEMIRNELKLNQRVVEFCQSKSKVIRQKSAQENIEDDSPKESSKYTTHPPLGKHTEKVPTDEVEANKGEMLSPSKKSKIPVKIVHKSLKTSSTSVFTLNDSDESVKTGGGEGIADINDLNLKEDIANEIKDVLGGNCNTSVGEIDFSLPKHLSCSNIEEEVDSERPPPLPKIKDCRTVLADAYYIMFSQNPEIFESLIVDNIEKNPDDCFKKAILFPLLELAPPKSAQLMLIDSIDENYLNDGTLITTLKGKNNTRSRNIAELLSNHIHLLPKWLFLVCTAKKQNKHITKMFSGFKKLTLDDLRKSHVVKDVQQYIINRLNVDFRGINLNKEVIDSLNQLYIKSNGCLLYLHKVLGGIKENFFTFREIKLIPCTLYGLFLYLCQKSFNKKQYMKIRPILNVLLACNEPVDKHFVYNCLRAHNYSIDHDEFIRRMDLMKNILEIDDERNTVKIFHNSFCEWLIDVKFSTKKFLCDLNEGHLLIAMYYTLISEQLCPNKVREYIFNLIKSAEYLSTKNSQLDVLLILLESKANLNDCFYSNSLNCCKTCEDEYRHDLNQSSRTKKMILYHLNGQLSVDFTNFLGDFFKPSLPTNVKILKLLMETGINNLDSQLSCDSSIVNSPLPSDKSQTIDSELADLLISSEKSCMAEQNVEASNGENSLVKDSSIKSERIDVGIHKGKAFIHILANDGNHTLMERALRACKGPIDLEIEDLNGQSALNIASRNGHINIVNLLLEFNWVRKLHQ